MKGSFGDGEMEPRKQEQDSGFLNFMENGENEGRLREGEERNLDRRKKLGAW